MTTEPLVLDQSDVAALLKTTTRTVRRLQHQKHFPRPIKTGSRRLLRWSRAAIMAYINSTK
jgi:predicted DNA-binding transcriptional regulator AlpA